MKVGRWSTTAGNNQTATPDGWPEGQAASTLNDCAREMMAQLRTVFNDSQFFDADLSPTFVNATSFTVPGDVSGALHSGRRLKLFDAATVYATIVSSTFAANTTITVVNDSGNLTASLSSFAIGILSRTNTSMPEGLSLSCAAMNVAGKLSVGGTLNVNVLSVSAVAAPNIARAWATFSGSAAGVTVVSSFNVASVSRSAANIFRINFTTAMVDANYVYLTGAPMQSISATASTFKFTYGDNVLISIAFYR